MIVKIATAIDTAAGTTTMTQGLADWIYGRVRVRDPRSGTSGVDDGDGGRRSGGDSIVGAAGATKEAEETVESRFHGNHPDVSGSGAIPATQCIRVPRSIWPT